MLYAEYRRKFVRFVNSSTERQRGVERANGVKKTREGEKTTRRKKKRDWTDGSPNP